MEMRRSTDGMRGQPPSWVHYMCFACFTTQPGETEYTAAGDVLGVYIPEGRFNVPGTKIYACCICRAFTRDAVWFVQPPHDQPACRHDPNTQAVRKFQTLYHNRPKAKARSVSIAVD